MDRCPNCRARWEGGASCRRCGMDLAPLLAVERAAESLLARAVAQIAAGAIEAASHTLEEARGLSADPLAVHLRRFVRSLRADARGSDQPSRSSGGSQSG
jgi:hypothetical protein